MGGVLEEAKREGRDEGKPLEHSEEQVKLLQQVDGLVLVGVDSIDHVGRLHLGDKPRLESQNPQRNQKRCA